MSTTPKSQLSPEESARLAELEPVIESGMAGFVQVGTALIAISDERLYRASYGSFEEYCITKWNLSARRAYQLCQASEVVTSLRSSTEKIITQTANALNEAQARELNKVPKADRAETLARVASKGRVTAAAISAELKPLLTEPAERSRGEVSKETVENLNQRFEADDAKQEPAHVPYCLAALRAHFAMVLKMTKDDVTDPAELGRFRNEADILAREFSNLQRDARRKLLAE